MSDTPSLTQPRSLLELSAQMKACIASGECSAAELLDVATLATDAIEALETTAEAAGTRAIMQRLHELLTEAPTHTRRTVQPGFTLNLVEAYMYADLDYLALREMLHETVINQFLQQYEPPAVNLLPTLVDLMATGHSEAAHYMFERYVRQTVREQAGPGELNTGDTCVEGQA